MNEQGILLFSGGIDSTLAALMLAENKIKLIGLSINYTGRPNAEIEAAKKVSKYLPFSEYIEISINNKYLLTKSEYISTKYEGWIPYRNLLFWSIAANLAVLKDAKIIAAGHHSWDGKTFNDASNNFFKYFSQILKYNGNNNFQFPIEVELPLLTSKERYIDDIAIANKDIVKKTWSCWRDKKKPCMICKACTERSKYFGQIFK